MSRMDSGSPSDCPFRVGIGFDFHRFAEGRDLVLGGVSIPHSQGLGGHSDADVLLHAVTDALLGAAGLSDIGSYFPDTDDRYRNISSHYLLETAYRLVRERDYSLVNVDVVILAEEPSIQPHREAIKTSLARLTGLPPDAIGIKATTMEGAGLIGRREGIAVQAVVLISK